MATKIQRGESKHRYKFRLPFNMIISGPTGCGKTTFIQTLLLNQEKAFDQKFQTIYYSYGIYQSNYDEIKKKVNNIHFMEGLPTIRVEHDTSTKKSGNVLCILDDLMLENEKQLASYFIRLRHAGFSIIFVTQCFFFSSKYMRLISRNCHYLVIFKNRRDSGVIRYLAQQIDPSNISKICETYKNCTQDAFSYLLFDMKPCTPDSRMLAINVMHPLKQVSYPLEECDETP